VVLMLISFLYCALYVLPADTSIIPAFPVCWEIFLRMSLSETVKRTISVGSDFSVYSLLYAKLVEALYYKPEGRGFESR
jgi:hypothetical protein